MSSINDYIKRFTGGNSVPDGLADWYTKTGNESLPDAENNWLKQRPFTITAAHNSDMWFEFLRADGYTGSLSDMLAAYWAAPSRVIPTFAGSQYGILDTPITFTGDFEVEVEFATTYTGIQVIIGIDADTNNFLAIQADGRFSIKVNAFEFSSLADVGVQDGKIHTALLTRISNTVTAYIDGVQVVTGTAAGSSTFDEIGAYNAGTLLFQGQILSTKFTDQSGTEDVVTGYVFDSGSTTEQFARGSSTLKVSLINFATTDWNRYTLQRNISHDAGVIGEAWVGDNVVVNGGFDTDTTWTKAAGVTISGGLCNFSAVVPGSGVEKTPSNTLISGVYLSSFVLSNYTSGEFQNRFGAAGFTPISANGKQNALKTISSISQFVGIRAATTNATGDVDDYKAQHVLELA